MDLRPDTDLAPVPAGEAKTPPPTEPVDSDDSGGWMKDRLLIGTRSAYRILTNEDSGHRGGRYGSGTFLGTIYALDQSQDLAPLRPFIACNVTKHIGIELAFDHEEADTLAASGSTDKSDGKLSLEGLTLTLIGKYPNSSRFTPYLGVGLGFFAADFKESAHWALGYPNEKTYIALGSPSNLYNDRSRRMDIENVGTLVICLGTMYRMQPSWLIDLSAQYFKTDVDAVFYGSTGGVLDTEQYGEFPLDNVAIRLGLVYQF
jgi:outer membrane protein W